MRVRRRSTLVGAVLVLEVVVAACGQPGYGGEGAGSAGSSPTAEPSPAHAPFDAEVELADGRRVGLSYAAGRGLLEQHRQAGAGAWSKPHLVYGTASDPCQSVTAKAFDDTVAVIANWGPYCADGEPPMESLAAVGTGDLSRWDTDLTKSFDGWEKVAAVDGPTRLEFTRVSTQWLNRLRWSRTEGFAEVEQVPR